MNKKTLRHFSFLLAILMMLFSAPSIFAIEFGDVKGNWAEEYISWCSAKNIIKGYEDGTFSLQEISQMRSLRLCSQEQ